MSRTFKDKNKRKYILGQDWYDRSYSRGRERSRIKKDAVNGSFYKKQTDKLDKYGGL